MTSVVNRYYDPATDQFLSIDPDVATTNQPYVYTNDNPLNSEDPLGLGAYQPKRWNREERKAEEQAAEKKPYNDKDYNSAEQKAKENAKHGWNADGTARGPVRGHSGQTQPKPTPGQGYNFSGIPDQFVQGIENVVKSPVTRGAAAVAGGFAGGWLIVVIVIGAPAGV